jgi:hypothetical protein
MMQDLRNEILIDSAADPPVTLTAANRSAARLVNNALALMADILNMSLRQPTQRWVNICQLYFSKIGQ